MPKVVKAFSVDSDVAQYIDEFPTGTRSEHVNWALRSYFFSTAADTVEMLRVSRDYYRGELLKQGGVMHHLRGLFRAILGR